MVKGVRQSAQCRQFLGVLNILLDLPRLMQCSGGAYVDANGNLYMPPNSQCVLNVQAEGRDPYITFVVKFSSLSGVLKWKIEASGGTWTGRLRPGNSYTMGLSFTWRFGFRLTLSNPNSYAVTGALAQATLVIDDLPEIAPYFLPLPDFTSFKLDDWFTRLWNRRAIIYLVYRSTDGAVATATLTENGITLFTSSTTSTTQTVAGAGRFFKYAILASYSWTLSANAELLAFYVDKAVFEPNWASKSISQSYSTTSTTTTTTDVLNLTTTMARVRRVMVSASSNATWRILLDGNVVLDSSWGVTSLDFNPPPEVKRVSVSYASADGTTATVTVRVIYDERNQL
jgi:hypothetical protein